MAHSIEPLTLVHKNGAGIKTTEPNLEFLVSFSYPYISIVKVSE